MVKTAKPFFETLVQKKTVRIPDSVLYLGSSMAHGQVAAEGGRSNWELWTYSLRRTLALKAEGKLDHFPYAAFLQGRSCEFDTRFRDDLLMAKRDLAHNTVRSSFSWPLMEPEKGVFSEEAFKLFSDMLDFAHSIDLNLILTFWHWTEPEWFGDKGGWLADDSPQDFLDFVKRLLDLFGSRIAHLPIITLNEPECHAWIGYRWADWPPQHKGEGTGRVAHENLAKAHRLAYTEIKQRYPDALVGIAKSNGYHAAYDDAPENRVKAARERDGWNKPFMELIGGYFDFFGLNHYMTSVFGVPDDVEVFPIRGDIGWDQHPGSIYYAVMEAWQYGKPVIITENGLADTADTIRPWFLHQSLLSIMKAIEDGADVHGILFWALLRNFEWAEGWTQDFGLVHVDLTTQRRTIRHSARFLADVYRDRAITMTTARKYANILREPAYNAPSLTR